MEYREALFHLIQPYSIILLIPIILIIPMNPIIPL
jgi:hypothetical protein